MLNLLILSALKNYQRLDDVFPAASLTPVRPANFPIFHIDLLGGTHSFFEKNIKVS